MCIDVGLSGSANANFVIYPTRNNYMYTYTLLLSFDGHTCVSTYMHDLTVLDRDMLIKVPRST